MTVEVTVPILPESIVDAVVSKYYKQPGDTVSAGESLVDLETDKVMLEIPAVQDGIVAAIAKPEGSTVVEGDTLLTLTAASQAATVPQSPADTAAPPAATASAEEAPAVVAPSSSSSVDAAISPAVRRLAREHQVNLSQVTGSGKNARISKQDVLAYIESQSLTSKAVVAPSPDDKVRSAVGPSDASQLPGTVAQGGAPGETCAYVSASCTGG